MDTGLLLQYLVIALAVLVSAWVVAVKQFPGGVRRLRMALALPLLRNDGPDNWRRALGRWIAPPGQAGNDAACGSCNSCKPGR
jgi:hypothetical protein